MLDVATLSDGYLPRVTNAIEAQRVQHGGDRGHATIDQPGLVRHPLKSFMFIRLQKAPGA
jgi:hypothetical protein